MEKKTALFIISVSDSPPPHTSFPGENSVTPLVTRKMEMILILNWSCSSDLSWNPCRYRLSAYKLIEFASVTADAKTGADIRSSAGVAYPRLVSPALMLAYLYGLPIGFMGRGTLNLFPLLAHDLV